MGFSASGAKSGASTGAAIGGPWGALIGGVAGAFLGGSKGPTPVAAANVKLKGSQAEAIQSNTDTFGDAAKLSTMQNDFQSGEQTRLLEKSIPGFGAIQQKMLANINDDLSNKGLSADVTGNIQRLAAERGITRGTSGGFNNFNLVRDFGFNMVDHENAKRARALSTLSSVYGMAPRVNPMTPMASFVSSSDAINNNRANENARYAEGVRMAGGKDQANADNSSRWAAVGQMGGQIAGDWAAGKIKGGG